MSTQVPAGAFVTQSGRPKKIAYVEDGTGQVWIGVPDGKASIPFFLATSDGRPMFLARRRTFFRSQDLEGWFPEHGAMIETAVKSAREAVQKETAK